MPVLLIKFMLSSKSPGNFMGLSSSLNDISIKYSFCLSCTSNWFHSVKEPFRWEVNFTTIWKIEKLFLIQPHNTIMMWVKIWSDTIYQVIISTHFQCTVFPHSVNNKLMLLPIFKKYIRFWAWTRHKQRGFNLRLVCLGFACSRQLLSIVVWSCD